MTSVDNRRLPIRANRTDSRNSGTADCGLAIALEAQNSGHWAHGFKPLAMAAGRSLRSLACVENSAHHKTQSSGETRAS